MRQVSSRSSAQSAARAFNSDAQVKLNFKPAIRPVPQNAAEQTEDHAISRRGLLIGTLISTVTASTSVFAPSPAAADIELPRGYQDTARSLVEALRDAIDIDLSGAPEREIRRKADPAKDLVKEFMTKWRDVPIVKDEVSYQQLNGAIRQLGDFYMKNGQRARLSEEVGQELLAKLEAAENSLPPAPEKKSLLPF